MKYLKLAWEKIRDHFHGPAKPSLPPEVPHNRRVVGDEWDKYHARRQGNKSVPLCRAEEPWRNGSVPETFQLPVIMVLLISPPGFDQRYNFVAQQLDAIGLPHTRLHTRVSNSHRRIDICIQNRAHTAVLVNHTFVPRADGAVGMPERMISLLYNHVEAWNQVAMQKHITLVLEDDVNISTSFMSTLRQSLWELETQPWDILWPGYCCCCPDGTPVSEVLSRHRKTGCTQSYILHPRSAMRMLRHMPTKLCYGSDHYMNALFGTLPCWKGFAFRKNLIVQDKRTFPNSTHRHASEEMVSW